MIIFQQQVTMHPLHALLPSDQPMVINHGSCVENTVLFACSNALRSEWAYGALGYRQKIMLAACSAGH